MDQYSIFQIIGPSMIGPSSSHTAGACRIGNAARKICGPGFRRAEFYLHGSFASTYKGHGTDKALVAGVLGIGPSDERLIKAMDIAVEEGLEFQFFKEDLGPVHPNTVKIVLYYENGIKKKIIGSSIGGGNIQIISIGENKILFNNQYPTIIFQYKEQKGVIARVSKMISESGYNIENINTHKSGQMVTLTVELSEEIDKDLEKSLLNLEGFSFIIYLSLIE